MAEANMTLDSVTIRSEREADAAAIHNVHGRAFPSQTEARLVAALRAHGKASVSLVAEVGGQIVGHILFSPVTLVGHAIEGVGLAPVAVVPEYQKRGIGGRLIREGLDLCTRKGIRFVVVLGDPAYYQRFGFLRATDHRLLNEYGVDEQFMVTELQRGVLPPSGGLVRYAPEFKDVEGPQPQEEQTGE
jgi:putative acetyltransferase